MAKDWPSERTGLVAPPAFSSSGECSDPHDMLFLMSRAGYKPVIEYCGGTETGGAYITGTVVQPVRALDLFYAGPGQRPCHSR